jgi:hypothetical protein
LLQVRLQTRLKEKYTCTTSFVNGKLSGAKHRRIEECGEELLEVLMEVEHLGQLKWFGDYDGGEEGTPQRNERRERTGIILHEGKS